jgi:hypothetical protein
MGIERTVKKNEDGSYDVIEVSRTQVQKTEMNLFRQKLSMQLESMEKMMIEVPADITRVRKELLELDAQLKE